MSFDVSYALEIFPILLRSAWTTILATAGGAVLAIVLGALIAVGRIAAPKPVALLLAAFVEFIRCTPLLVQLFFLFYVLPQYGLMFSALATGIFGLGLHYSTYMSEAIRTAVLSVAKGQWEATTALNMPQALVWRRIIGPQALPLVVPIIANQIIAMLKESALLATITVRELLGVALNEAAFTYRYVEPITLVGLLFLVLSTIAALLAKVLERHVAIR